MKKKWLIAIIILVIIAVVLAIVFINLFRPKDTKSLAESLNNYVSTGYLFKGDEDCQSATIDRYLAYIQDNPQISSEEQNTIKNERQAYLSYIQIGEFFNRQIIFMDATSVYQREHSKIKDALKKAQKSADALADYINRTVLELTGGHEYWDAATWVECKQNMADIFNNTTDAVNRLIDVYIDAMPVYDNKKEGGMLNNDFTSLIFSETKAMIEDVTTKLTTDATYSQTLKTFVDAYFSENCEALIESYVYSQPLQQIVQDIKELGKDSNFYPQFIEGNII